MEVVHYNKEEFLEAVNTSEKPVVVDFWAEWCGPCKMLAPIMEKVAEEVGDKAVIAKVNIDDEQELAQSLQIMSIPTVIIYSGGQAVDGVIGLTSQEEIIDKINQYIGD